MACWHRSSKSHAVLKTDAKQKEKEKIHDRKQHNTIDIARFLTTKPLNQYDQYRDKWSKQKNLKNRNTDNQMKPETDEDTRH